MGKIEHAGIGTRQTFPSSSTYAEVVHDFCNDALGQLIYTPIHIVPTCKSQTSHRWPLLSPDWCTPPQGLASKCYTYSF